MQRASMQGTVSVRKQAAKYRRLASYRTDTGLASANSTSRRDLLRALDAASFRRDCRELGHSEAKRRQKLRRRAHARAKYAQELVIGASTGEISAPSRVRDSELLAQRPVKRTAPDTMREPEPEPELGNVARQDARIANYPDATALGYFIKGQGTPEEIRMRRT